MNLKEEKIHLFVHEEIPITVTGHAHGDNRLLFHHHHPSDVPPPPPSSLPLLSSPPLSSSPQFMEKTQSVKYGECLKNHAAAIGGNAIDGCGEFMPSGEDDTIDALKCSACGCHRNFHRKQIAGDQQHSFDYRERRKLVSNPSAEKIMPWCSLQSSVMAKRRHRTRFTAEQKEKMMSFAEKAGWRIQNEEEGMVEKLCDEIGVKRRAFKVWMHNNKNNFTKKANNLLLD